MSDPTDTVPESYASAQDELRSLLRSLQDDRADLDEMTARVARAKELIAWSRNRLRATQETVDQLLDTSQQQD